MEFMDNRALQRLKPPEECTQLAKEKKEEWKDEEGEDLFDY